LWFETKDQPVVHGYSNRSFPDAGIKADYFTVTYYDDYELIGDAEVKTVTNKAGQEIKTATMSDGTNVTFRTFSSSEQNANAVIQLNNKELQEQGAKPVEIKFFNK
jgi:hypothetical protein